MWLTPQQIMGFVSRLTEKRCEQSLPQRAHKTTAQKPQSAEAPEATYVDVFLAASCLLYQNVNEYYIC